MNIFNKKLRRKWWTLYKKRVKGQSYKDHKHEKYSTLLVNNKEKIYFLNIGSRLEF